MLNVLEHSEMCEITVVITRYFGGIKLGAGGLVRAYSQALAEALKKLPIREKIHLYAFSLSLPHSLVGEVEHHLAEAKVQIKQRDWTDKLCIDGQGSREALAKLQQLLANLQHLIQYQDETQAKQ